LHPIDAGDNITDAAGLTSVLTRWPILEEVILAADTTIVLTSTWRHGLEVQADGSIRVCASAGSRRRLLCTRLLELLQGRLVSKTPRHPQATRSAEILEWVSRFEPSAWVAIDDELANVDGLPESRRVVTESASGLTRDDAKSVLRKLRAQMLAGTSAIPALQMAVCARLVPPAGSGYAWQIAYREDVGRHLVAARDLAAGEIVFAEKPLITALVPTSSEVDRALRSEIVAVAIQLLAERADSDVYLLQPAEMSKDADGARVGSMRAWTREVLRALRARPPMMRSDDCEMHMSELDISEEALEWALSVASVNVHGRSDPRRGVLGLLASMMQHECAPSAHAEIAAADGTIHSAIEGSMSSSAIDGVITLRTKRAIKAGESLSITYVPMDAPLNERRRMLRLCHGFVCECARCVAELAATSGESGEAEGGEWRLAWEDRIWAGDVDPYTGDLLDMQ